MYSLEPWQSPVLDQAELPVGQNWFDLSLIDEPESFNGETQEIDDAMYVPVSEQYLDQDTASLYDHFLSSNAPFSEHRQITSLPVDSWGNPIDMSTPRSSRISCHRYLKEEHGTRRSTSSTETECSNEDDQQGHVCQECNKLFRNLQELDRHTKGVEHKAWRCAEPFCGRTYARRDTFLRHRATHKDKGHACSVCSLRNKQKVFKRKDHLKEHMRNCHSKGTDATSVENARFVRSPREPNYAS